MAYVYCYLDLFTHVYLFGTFECVTATYAYGLCTSTYANPPHTDNAPLPCEVGDAMWLCVTVAVSGDNACYIGIWQQQKYIRIRTKCFEGKIGRITPKSYRRHSVGNSIHNNAAMLMSVDVCIIKMVGKYWTRVSRAHSCVPLVWVGVCVLVMLNQPHGNTFLLWLRHKIHMHAAPAVTDDVHCGCRSETTEPPQSHFQLI